MIGTKKIKVGQLDKTTLDTLYQSTLVSATNIKTINGTSILGSGDLVVSGGTDTIAYYFQGGVSMPTINTWYGNASGFGINGTTTFGNGATPAFPFATIGSLVIPSGYIIQEIIFGEFTNPVSVAHNLEIYIARGEFTTEQLTNTLTNYDVIANETLTIGYLSTSPKYFKNLTIASHSAKEKSAIQIAMRQKTNNSQSTYSMTIILKKA